MVTHLPLSKTDRRLSTNFMTRLFMPARVYTRFKVFSCIPVTHFMQVTWLNSPNRIAAPRIFATTRMSGTGIVLIRSSVSRNPLIRAACLDALYNTLHAFFPLVIHQLFPKFVPDVASWFNCDDVLSPFATGLSLGLCINQQFRGGKYVRSHKNGVILRAQTEKQA
jgi:hypothetical protein